MPVLNETHNPDLRSWVSSANSPETDFPIQNLPFAEFRRKHTGESFRGGVAIGDQVLDLAAAQAVFSGKAAYGASACAESTLNTFMSMGSSVWSALRLALSRALREGAKEQSELEHCLVAQSDIEFSLPCTIGDYTDFYTSVFHATRVGSLFRDRKSTRLNSSHITISYAVFCLKKKKHKKKRSNFIVDTHEEVS